MPGGVPKRVFISYSRQDGADFARQLREELKAAGFEIWHDISALEGDRDWWSQIEEALRSKELHHLVLVLTPAALASKVVRDEIRLARQEGKTVSPVKGPGLDPSAVPRWIRHVYDLHIPEQRALLMRVLVEPSKQARVPMMAPEPPADFVQRPAEFGVLKRKLLDAKGDAVAITAALRGAGGYGKTTLARALAHDPDIQDAYFDGILWVELGESPANLLSIISDLIETMTGERPGLENLNAAASKLGEAFGDRRILLVIDDAWREQDLLPFSHGGRNTTRLITTRRDDILPLKAERQPVDAMRAGEALALLAAGLPEDQAAARRPALEALAARLGEWAQLLKLVNGFLRDRVVKGHQPLDQAIAGVNKRLTEKGLDAFSARDEADRGKAIAKTIGVSLDLLSESARARFAELAVFPEDVDVPIGVAARLWAKNGGLDETDAEELLVRLENLSLLLSLDLGRRSFRFHDTVRHFLLERAGKDALAALHKTLLQAMDGAGTDADEAMRRYHYLYRPAHLAAAGERAALDALLENPAWLQAKLNALESPQALIADYEQFGQGEVQDLIGRTLRLTSGICARDKQQLLSQLHGRLLAQAAAAPFCAAAWQRAQRPALLTLRASLTPPGAETARLRGHGGPVRALAVLPDGRLASGSDDSTVRLWDLKTGAEAARLQGHGGPVNALVVLPDGRLASGSDDNTVRLWDLKTCTESMRLEGHGASVRALAVAPDGRLVSGSDDSTIRLWDLEAGAEAARLRGHGGPVRALAALPDGRLASGSDDKTIRFWEFKAGLEVARLGGHRGPVKALAVLPDGHLASGSDDNTVRLWNLGTGSETATLEGHCEGASSLAVLPDGRLASGSDDKTVRLWDLKSGAEAARLEGHCEGVRALAVLPDGRLASASGGMLGTVRLWDLKTGAEAARLQGHRGSVLALALLPDGRLASGSGGVLGTVRLWDLKTGAEVARFQGHGGPVNALAVLPDGRLASGSEDSTIRLWDLGTGAEAARLEGHGGRVNALAVLPDGRLASGSEDNTIRIWDFKAGTEITRLEIDARVFCLVALPDGCLAAGDKLGRLHWFEILD